MQAYPYTRPVHYAESTVRADFIRRTYQHLAGAVLAFLVVEALLLQWSGAAMLARSLTRGYSWLLVLAAFMGISWLAEKWAHSGTSPQMQYLGLGLYVVAEAVIFLPLLYIASFLSSPNVIPTAGIITGLLFMGLTYYAWSSQKDFSFLSGVLSIGGFVALGSYYRQYGFRVSLRGAVCWPHGSDAGAAILYNTSNVMHQYRPDQHVAASLALFASVALLFWYVVQVVMSLSDSD